MFFALQTFETSAFGVETTRKGLKLVLLISIMGSGSGCLPSCVKCAKS